MVRRAKEASDERREIAAIRRKYYDALRDGLSKEDAAAFAQGETPKKPAAVKPAAAVSSKPDDDLTKIQGIGSGFVVKLKNVGVTRFDQIASWTDAQVKRHDEEFGLRGRITREGWVKQAKQLVK